jgi:hypothetical protein
VAYTVDDYEQLLEILGRHPDFVARLRDLLVGDQLERIDERLTRIELAIEAQSRQIEAQGKQIEAQGRQIEAQGKQIEALGLRLDTVVRTVEELTEQMRLVNSRLGSIEGWRVEDRFVTNGPGLLGPFVRKAVRLSAEDLDELDDAVADGRITRAERVDLGLADSLFRGKTAETRRDIIVAIEASRTIDLHDIDRAETRAQTLRRAGYNATGMVAGLAVRPEDEARARSRGVAIMVGGLMTYWPEAAA